MFPKDRCCSFSVGSFDLSPAVVPDVSFNHQVCCCYSLKDAQGDVGAKGVELMIDT